MPIVLILLVFLPLAAAALIGLRAPARATSLGTAIVMVFLVAALNHYFDRESPSMQFASSLTVMENPGIALAFGIDGMSLVMLLLSVLVLFAALWMIDPLADNARLQYAGSLLIAGGAIGAFASTDLFFFFAFHELALIPTFLLIGMCGRGSNARSAAWRITLYLGLGSLILLVGLLALHHALGQPGFSITELHARAMADPIAPETQSWIALLLIIGFGSLVSLVPLHSWAAPAYAAAPTPVAMLHAGVLKKFGLYGLLRVAVPMLPEGMREWAGLLLVLLLLNIIYMGLVTIACKRLDTMFGCSSVMHMGYLFLAVAALSLTGPDNTLAYRGAILLMFAHGVSIALLFALADRIESRTGTLEIARLSGLGRAMPSLGFLFGIAAFASIGLPGLANFAGELLVFLSGFHGFRPSEGLQPLQWATILAVWGVVISAVYMLRAYRTAFMGDPDASRRHDVLTTEEKLPLAALAGALVVVGFFPNLLLQYLPF